MEMAKRSVIAIVLFFPTLIGLIALFPSYANARPIVTAEEVRFDPVTPLPGQRVAINVYFQVTNGPVNMNMSYSVDPASSESGDPLVVGGSIPTGRNRMQLSYTVPAPAPPQITFNIYAHFPGTGLTRALFVNNACLGIKLRSARQGTGEGVTLVPGVPPGGSPSASSTLVGHRCAFELAQVNSGVNNIPIPVVMSVENARATFNLHLYEDGREVSKVRFSRDPGVHRLTIPRVLTADATHRVPGTLHCEVKASFTAAPDSPQYLLIRDIQLESFAYVVSYGVGQRIEVPGREVAPAPDVKPARPEIKKK